MKIRSKRTKNLLASALLLSAIAVPSVSLVAAEESKSAQLTPMISIDGSSTVYPITEAVAEEFQKAEGGKVNVTVGISGTGGGFKKFTRGETDISDASRPIQEKEIEEAKKNGIEFMELPVAFDALTVVVNKKNTWVDSLTVSELKKIWEPEAQEKVKSWKQVRDSFPDVPLKLYGPGADSGTFDYFTEAVVGKAKMSRGDYTASEDDNVIVQGIASDKGGLGYFGYSYYVENQDKLKAVPIVNPKTSKAVTPGDAVVVDGSYAPLSRPLFIYVSKKATERAEVKKFVTFYFDNVPTLAKDVKYVPLPESTYQKAKDRFNAHETGTVFGGHSEVGLHIDELFTKPLVK